MKTKAQKAAARRRLAKLQGAPLLSTSAVLERKGMTNSGCITKAAESGDLKVAACYKTGTGKTRYLFDPDDVDAWTPRPRGWHGQDEHWGETA